MLFDRSENKRFARSFLLLFVFSFIRFVVGCARIEMQITAEHVTNWKMLDNQ